MRKIGKAVGWILVVAMYLIQVYGYYVIYGPIAALIAFVFPPSMLAYPFFFHAARGFWPVGWILWFVVGFVLTVATQEKNEPVQDT